MFTDIWHDITALCSAFISLLFTVRLFLLGNPFLAVQLSIALASCYAIAVPIKTMFFKKRPNNQQFSNLYEKFSASSFPSVHSMRAVCFGIILSFFLNTAFFYSIALIAVSGVMYSRIKLRKHYWGDALAGAAFGIMIGVLVVYFEPAKGLMALIGG